jgi:hypothetical protein
MYTPFEGFKQTGSDGNLMEQNARKKSQHKEGQEIL